MGVFRIFAPSMSEPCRTVSVIGTATNRMVGDPIHVGREPEGVDALFGGTGAPL
jgi:hypothetical protein